MDGWMDVRFGLACVKGYSVFVFVFFFFFFFEEWGVWWGYSYNVVAFGELVGILRGFWGRGAVCVFFFNFSFFIFVARCVVGNALVLGGMEMLSCYAYLTGYAWLAEGRFWVH